MQREVVWPKDGFGAGELAWFVCGFILRLPFVEFWESDLFRSGFASTNPETRRHPLDFAKRRQVIEIGAVALRSFAGRCTKMQKNEAKEEKSLRTRAERHSADAES